MKKTMFQRSLSVLLAVMLLVGMMLLSGCRSEPLVIKDSDTYIVIKTTQEAIGEEKDMLLIDYMAKQITAAAGCFTPAMKSFPIPPGALWNMRARNMALPFPVRKPCRSRLTGCIFGSLNLLADE